MSRGCRIGAAALFLCSANLYSVRRALAARGYGGQSSKLISVLVDCPGDMAGSRQQRNHP